MLGTDSSTLRREVVPCQMDLFGNIDKRVRHPIAAMALARTEHLHLGHKYPCIVCGAEKNKSQYSLRKRRNNEVYERTCKSCHSKRVAESNKTGNQAYLQEHGCSRVDVLRYAQRVGGTWADTAKPVFIAEYIKDRDGRRQQRQCEIQARRDAEQAERDAREVDRQDARRMSVEQAWADWDSFGRLTESQAWRDWSATSPPEWWAANGLIPPSKSFATYSLYWAYKYANNPEFRLMERNRRRVKKLTRGKLFCSLDLAVSGSVHGRTGDSYVLRDLIGYNSDELRRDIESKFTDGMSVDQLDKIHVDHIVPCDMFDMSDEREVKACWALCNLQPLWAADNLRKQTKIYADQISDELAEHLRVNAPRVYGSVFS